MGYYLVQFTYTPEAWATLIKTPQNRVEAVRPAIEKLGGSFEGVWFSFGEYDTVAILKMPDNTSAAAFSLMATAGGALKAFKTTPLLTVEEGIEAMKQAGTAGYRPPS